MRVEYADDEDFAGQFALMDANRARSIRGKHGQAALLELEQALLAMPDKRIFRDVFIERGEMCTLAALFVYKKSAEGLSRADAIREGEKVDPWDSEMAGIALGVPRLVAWDIIMHNDDIFKRCSAEERYTRMLEYVRAQIVR